MIHPHTELKFIHKAIGYGVVATRFIPKGTITWVMDALDRRFTQQDIDNLDPLYSDIVDKYMYRDNHGDYILCWDHARFVNHSFFPSCITTAYDFELAVRDIQSGEELTNDYGTLNVNDPFFCLAEKGANRQVVMPDDLLHYHQDWDIKLISAFQNLPNVEQPLSRFLPKEVYTKAVAIAMGDREMDSIVSCYYGINKQKNQLH